LGHRREKVRLDPTYELPRRRSQILPRREELQAAQAVAGLNRPTDPLRQSTEVPTAHAIRDGLIVASVALASHCRGADLGSYGQSRQNRLEEAMARTKIAFAVLAIVAGSAAAGAQTPTWTPTAEKDRCPSKWGAGDERGSANHIKPAIVLKTAQMIKTGEVIELAHVLNEKMPFFGTRRFDVHIKRTFMNQPSNKRGSNEEIVISEIGQVGTQFDGFAHQSHEDSLYNCFKVSELAGRTGFSKLGVHQVGTIMTRGVLIDVAAFKGVPTLPDTYEITVEDLEGALKKQGTTLQAGDAILVNTGWHKLWAVDNARYVKSCPGLGLKAAQWLISKDPVLLGADNWPVEVAPNPDPTLSLPMHQLALVVNGVHLLENLKLDELATKNVYEFAFLMQPMKMQGATGSTVTPVAIR
jgi:kynurenine formamidase